MIIFKEWLMKRSMSRAHTHSIKRQQTAVEHRAHVVTISLQLHSVSHIIVTTAEILCGDLCNRSAGYSSLIFSVFFFFGIMKQRRVRISCFIWFLWS